MLEYREQFKTYMGVKNTINKHEEKLFVRAVFYVKKLRWIPGIRMVAVVNSLSMYATHKDSDIDLFIVAEKGTLWWVRFWITLTFFIHGVWRHKEDIRENFCLSFFITTESEDMSRIALKHDIYLYYWVYFLKPIIEIKGSYDEFLRKNTWVSMDEMQKTENTKFLSQIQPGGKFSMIVARGGNSIIRFLTRWKTLKRYEELGRPEGVTISESMLKFHDKDRRKEIRDAILSKNFDK